MAIAWKVLSVYGKFLQGNLQEILFCKVETSTHLKNGSKHLSILGMSVHQASSKMGLKEMIVLFKTCLRRSKIVSPRSYLDGIKVDHNVFKLFQQEET